MKTIVEAQGVSKTYGRGASDVHAVKNVSLSVQEGEMVVLMGPSGSGKTTLLLMCGALLKPDSGKITIEGQEVSALQERALPSVRLKKVGFIFQQFNLLPELTALENVEVVANLAGVNGRKARELAAGALESVGLQERLSHLPEDLSGGEKQRVAIARAVLNRPRLLIADEPTGNLDSETGQEITRLIREMVKELGNAAIVATHDARIESLADRVLHLRDGNLA
jgi:putative ABC transport system ATP-binding protein